MRTRGRPATASRARPCGGRRRTGRRRGRRGDARRRKITDLRAEIARLEDEVKHLEDEAVTDRNQWRAWHLKKTDYEKMMANALACLLDRPIVTLDPDSE